MILEVLIALSLGILAGTFTGLAPGIHINLVALLLYLSSNMLLDYTLPIVLAVFIVSMSITHTFLDFIPSIFLGAPEESTILSVLPGHDLLLQGRGYEAVKLTIIGGYLGLILAILITPIFIFALPKIYELSRGLVPFMLIVASAFLIWKEPRGKRFLAFTLFTLSGILGVLTLNFKVISEPLFPLLTGLFGTSIMLLSLRTKASIPEQDTKTDHIKNKEIWKVAKSGVIAGSLCSFLPGLGASQAAVLGSSFSKIEKRTFLILLGIIGTVVSVLNFIALYAINKPRSGTAVIVGKLLELNINSLLLLISAMLVSGSIAVFISIFFAKLFARNITKISYSKLNWIVLVFLVTLCILVSGPWSLLVLITATALGILASEYEIKKMQLMGCLIIPVIIYLIN